MQKTRSSIDFSKSKALQKLNHNALQALSKIAVLRQLKSNEVLYYQGDMAHAFYIIQEGGIRLIEHTPDGQDVSLKIYGPGDIFGLLAVSGSFPHPSRAEAIQDSLVIAFDGQDARHLMLDYPELALTVIDLLVNHVHAAHYRIREFAAEKVDRRIARSLLHLCDKFGKCNGSEICIDIPISQQDMAEFAGTTLETVNRTLKNWEEKGLVRLSRKHIDVLNRNALFCIVEDVVLQT